MSPGFTRGERLHLSRDFADILKNGRYFKSEYLNAAGRRREKPPSRLGLVVSRKVGPAASRIRLKRRLREIFRLAKGGFENPCDIIFIPKPGATALNYSQLRELAARAFASLGAGAE